MFNENASFNSQMESNDRLHLEDVDSWVTELEEDCDANYENADSMNYFGAGSNKKGCL